MKIYLRLSIAVLALLCAACKTTIIENNDTGSFKGKITAFGALCDSLPDASGATVQIAGTNFSAQTDKMGAWSIHGVPAGIYDLTITKPGFDTDLISQDQFIGAGTQFLMNGIIHEYPKDSITISSISTITRKDSTMRVIHERDSVGIVNPPYDSTFRFYDTTYDTLCHIYSFNLSLIMNGPDSVIYFYPELGDITHPMRLYLDIGDWNYDPIQISRNVPWTRNARIIVYSSPIDGDMIKLATQVQNRCSMNGPLNSKNFVLP